MLTLLAALLTTAPSTDLFASLKPGQWQFHRVVPDPHDPLKTKPIDVTTCEDLAQAQKRQRAMLEKVGCTFGETTRTGDTFTTVVRCEAKGVKSRATNVSTLTKDGYTSTIDTEGEQGGKAVTQHETLTARRVGDCTPLP